MFIHPLTRYPPAELRVHMPSDDAGSESHLNFPHAREEAAGTLRNAGKSTSTGILPGQE